MSNKNNIGRIPETGAMTAYERWELPSLDEKDEAANEIEIEPVTAEEVESIRHEAYQEGLVQGQEKGYQEGLAKGQKDGHAEGLKSGNNEGTKKGYDKGLKQGLADGQKEIKTEVKNLSDLMARFDQPLAELDKQVQDSLLNVITAVSRTVIHRELQTDSSQVSELLKQGLDQMESSREQIEVTVNPVDLIHVENAAEEAGATWKIVGDDSILPGGLKLKSGPSLVDLTAEHRFQQAILNLLGRTDWAVDLASDQADETQKALSSLAKGYDVPDDVIDTEEVGTEALDSEEQAQGAETNEPSEETSTDSCDEEPLEQTAEPVADPLAEEAPLTEEMQTEDSTEGVDAESSDAQDVEDESAFEEDAESISESESILDQEQQTEDTEPESSELTPETSEVSSEPEFETFEESVVKDVEPKVEEASNLDDSTATSLEPETSSAVPAEESKEQAFQEGFEPSDQAEETDVFDFDASSHDENTTVYPENQKVSDLMAQEDLSETNAADTNQAAPLDSTNEHDVDGAMSDPSNQQNAASQGAAAGSEHPEVKPMMQPTSQGNGFEAFAWQTPQAQQAQAHAQALNQQAQQAQMQAQAANAQAQHAQMQAQQAQAQAQAMSQQAHAQSQMQYQQQYSPQQMPQQGIPQPGMPQPGMVMPQGYPQQMPMQQPMQGVPGMMPMQPNMPQPTQQGMQGQWGNHQGMPVQPVPLVPAQQGNFSAFSYSAPNYFNPQGQNQTGAQPHSGFAPYPYPIV